MQVLKANSYKLKARSAFTLIEILIVVAIIGILASVVLVGTRTVTKQGGDARRISDLKNIQTALELYYNKTGNYPADSGWEGLLTGGNIGVSKIPKDPDGTSYNYCQGASGISYVLGAQLEDVNNPALKQSAAGSCSSKTCGSGGFYCVSI